MRAWCLRKVRRMLRIIAEETKKAELAKGNRGRERRGPEGVSGGAKASVRA